MPRVGNDSGYSAPASAIATTEISPRSFHAPLKFAVANDEDVLFLAADKLDALVNTRVELVETCEHVTQVENWTTFMVNLVEDVVPEELQVVAFTGLAPCIRWLVEMCRWVC